MSKHWTARNIENFLSRITFDFVAQIEKKMDAIPNFKQADLAKKLEVSEADVSQVLNNRPNLRLKTIVRYAQALGLNVALVAYENDENKVVNSELFSLCWEREGKPQDLFELQDQEYAAVEMLSPEMTGILVSASSKTQATSAGVISNNVAYLPNRSLRRSGNAAKNLNDTDAQNFIPRKKIRA